MTYGTDTRTLRDRFKDFVQNKDELKKDLEEYITSPVHSLELRWQMFLDAPQELNNHDRWIYHGWDRILDHTSSHPHLNLINDLDWRERGSEIDVVEMVDEVFSDPEEYGLSYPGIYEEGFVDKIKEQILKDNIKTFKYDW